MDLNNSYKNNYGLPKRAEVSLIQIYLQCQNMTNVHNILCEVFHPVLTLFGLNFVSTNSAIVTLLYIRSSSSNQGALLGLQ